MRKLLKILRENWILVVILCIGLFLRAYKPLELFAYNHDQDLAGWFIKDVLVNHHFRLVGQETSSKGIFIGPLFYYLQIPFYLIAGMDPAGALALPVIIGVFAIFSCYFVLSKVFSKNAGLIGTLVYAVSYLVVFTGREVVPTMPAMLWSIWYFYCLWLILKGNQKAYLLIGFLFGLIWNFNLALAILSPLVLVAQFFLKKRIDFKQLFIGLLIFIILMLPFFVFETRHNFQQVKALVSSFTTLKDYVPETGRGLVKLDRVLQLVHRNTTSLFLDSVTSIPIAYTFYLLIISFAVLCFKKIISNSLAIIMFLWQILYLVFFTLNSINVSEYYLNGMNIIWIAIFAVSVSNLIKNKTLKYLGFALIIAVTLISLLGFFKKDINKSGYVERKALVSYIAQDAKKHEYPCIAISYITSPGNNMGYRYLFWREGLHVNSPDSGSPVYTIVYPLSMVYGVDKKFGVLGLVLPDYQRYTKEEIKVSCSGKDPNLTNPLFSLPN